MKIENQVVSLKLAKEMKELGFRQNTLYFWYESKEIYETKKLKHLVSYLTDTKKEFNGGWKGEYFSAPTVAEMLTFATNKGIIKNEDKIKVREINANEISKRIINYYEK